MRISVTPPCSTSTSASPSLAQVSPTAPAASCIRAMCGLLCVFACGRSDTPWLAASAAISAMLCSSKSRSTAMSGVSSAWSPATMRCSVMAATALEELTLQAAAASLRRPGHRPARAAGVDPATLLAGAQRAVDQLLRLDPVGERGRRWSVVANRVCPGAQQQRRRLDKIVTARDHSARQPLRHWQLAETELAAASGPEASLADLQGALGPREGHLFVALVSGG